MGSYIVYLCSLIIIRSKIVVGFWFILHLTEEVLQFKQNNDNEQAFVWRDMNKYISNHFETVWNYFDLFRLLIMIGFMC